MPLSDKNELSALLREAGIDTATAEAVIDIDGLMQKWRRRAMKRELGHRALVTLKIGIDLAQYDVLAAIEAPEPEFGERQGETMVATVAERLGAQVRLGRSQALGGLRAEVRFPPTDQAP